VCDTLIAYFILVIHRSILTMAKNNRKHNNRKTNKNNTTTTTTPREDVQVVADTTTTTTTTTTSTSVVNPTCGDPVETATRNTVRHGRKANKKAKGDSSHSSSSSSSSSSKPTPESAVDVQLTHDGVDHDDTLEKGKGLKRPEPSSSSSSMHDDVVDVTVPPERPSKQFKYLKRNNPFLVAAAAAGDDDDDGDGELPQPFFSCSVSPSVNEDTMHQYFRCKMVQYVSCQDPTANLDANVTQAADLATSLRPYSESHGRSILTLRQMIHSIQEMELIMTNLPQEHDHQSFSSSEAGERMILSKTLLHKNDGGSDNRLERSFKIVEPNVKYDILEVHTNSSVERDFLISIKTSLRHGEMLCLPMILNDHQDSCNSEDPASAFGNHYVISSPGLPMSRVHDDVRVQALCIAALSVTNAYCSSTSVSPFVMAQPISFSILSPDVPFLYKWTFSIEDSLVELTCVAKGIITVRKNDDVSSSSEPPQAAAAAAVPSVLSDVSKTSIIVPSTLVTDRTGLSGEYVDDSTSSATAKLFQRIVSSFPDDDLFRRCRCQTKKKGAVNPVAAPVVLVAASDPAKDVPEDDTVTSSSKSSSSIVHSMLPSSTMEVFPFIDPVGLEKERRLVLNRINYRVTTAAKTGQVDQTVDYITRSLREAACFQLSKHDFLPSDTGRVLLVNGDLLYSAVMIRANQEITAVPLTKLENVIKDGGGTWFTIPGLDGFYVPLRKATPFCGFGGFATFKSCGKAPNCVLEQLTVPRSLVHSSTVTLPCLVLRASKDIPPMSQIVVDRDSRFLNRRRRTIKHYSDSCSSPVDGTLHELSAILFPPQSVEEVTADVTTVNEGNGKKKTAIHSKRNKKN